MTRDDSATDTMVAFCKRLPRIVGEPAQARAEANTVLACFAQRRQELQRQGGSGGAAGDDFAGMRCEIEALDAASNVVRQVWALRFGTALEDHRIPS